ncbi:3-oxoacyl-[acyl-carrier-protein] synthase III C-terminal domain-containing protein [Bacillus pacificus]
MKILGSAIITDGSFHEDVRIPAGGSKQVASYDTVKNRQHYIDVIDPNSMKERLDRVSIPNFDKVIREALRKSGLTPKDIKSIITIAYKTFYVNRIDTRLGLEEEQVVYLDHYGHMSALDPCIGLHFANGQGKLQAGDIAVVVSAGTGYTWAATVIRW